jgi:hypothetical protein
VVNDDPFSPEEAEFFMEILKEGGYDLPAWEERAEGYEEIEETDG